MINCGDRKSRTFHPGEGAHKLDRYPFRKMRKSQEHYTHTKIKFPIVFFYDGYLKFSSLGSGAGGRAGRGFLRPFFFYYYFINAIILTLHISSFIVVYIDIWHIVTVCYVLMCLSPPMKSTLLVTKNESTPPVFDLRGWNRHHFVRNWIV